MHVFLALLLSFAVVACATDEAPISAEGPEFKDPSDLEVVPDIDSKGDEVLPYFDANFIVDDAFFTHDTIVTDSELQTFFEDSPYGNRSWLADATFDGQSAAEALIEVSQEFDINPLMLLIRLQVEQGLVSKTVRPAERKIERALGCGCADGQACSSRFIGFKNQMRCGAEAHRNLINLSMDGRGQWRMGKGKSTLDPTRVVPQNHATAALYAYTPWVLRGRGGNWLVWNIARKFTLHLEAEGLIKPPAWVGTPCEQHDDCVFSANNETGFCFDFEDTFGTPAGFCTVTCEGTCPDRAGSAPTFCIDAGVANLGICASQAVAANNQCSDLPGTRVEERDRFVGSSGATARQSVVCAPDTP